MSQPKSATFRATRLMTEHLVELERVLHLDAAREPPSLADIFGNS